MERSAEGLVAYYAVKVDDTVQTIRVFVDEATLDASSAGAIGDAQNQIQLSFLLAPTLTFQGEVGVAAAYGPIVA